MQTFQKLKRKTLRTFFRYDPSFVDMYDDPSEAYFARLYLYHMESYLENLPENAAILDAGCQAGRFLVPLAKMGFQLTGIDSSGLSLDRARKHCRAYGAEVQLMRGDIQRICDRLPKDSFDAIVCTEVLYLHRHYHQLLSSMIKALKKEGLLFSSHRTKFYYLLRALREKDYATARYIIENQEGDLGGTYFNWQTIDQLKILHQQHGLKTLGIHPIGIFSEIVVSPGELDEQNRESLFKIEKEPFDEVTGCTRYLLAIGQKISVPDPHLP